MYSTKPPGLLGRRGGHTPLNMPKFRNPVVSSHEKDLEQKRKDLEQELKEKKKEARAWKWMARTSPVPELTQNSRVPTRRCRHLSGYFIAIVVSV
jgi:hypothetical protein